jgi:hypothetical protein
MRQGATTTSSVLPGPCVCLCVGHKKPTSCGGGTPALLRSRLGSPILTVHVPIDSHTAARYDTLRLGRNAEKRSQAMVTRPTNNTVVFVLYASGLNLAVPGCRTDRRATVVQSASRPPMYEGGYRHLSSPRLCVPARALGHRLNFPLS